VLQSEYLETLLTCQDLYETSRWDYLREYFLRMAFQIHGLILAPLVHIPLSTGLSSLKTAACANNATFIVCQVKCILTLTGYRRERIYLFA